MNRSRTSRPPGAATMLAAIALAATLASMAAGCASPAANAPVTSAAPASSSLTSPSETASSPAAPGCTELAQAIAQAGNEAGPARERQAGAWKLVVPFAVLARHAQAGRELEAAEQRQAALRARAARQGCGDAS